MTDFDLRRQAASVSRRSASRSAAELLDLVLEHAAALSIAGLRAEEPGERSLVILRVGLER
jgi:hypothetical protein